MNVLLGIIWITSTMLACVIVYAFWVKIRFYWLRADLLQILVELHSEAVKRKATTDPGYRGLRRTLEALYEKAGYFSLPVVIYVTSHGKRDHSAGLFPRAATSEFQTILEQIWAKTSARLGRAVFTESLTGLLLRVIAIALPRKTALEEGTAAIEKSMEELDRSLAHSCQS